jgi:hypothetical protein
VGYRKTILGRPGRTGTTTYAARLVVALLIGGFLWTSGPPAAHAQTGTSTTTPIGKCASGPCPLNIGGSFSWQDNGTSVSGQFTGSIVAYPIIVQASCATAAGLDSAKGPTTGPLAPHPGLMVPEPFTKPGPGKPLTANIDITVYHGPGTYTNAAFAHQTYAYPAGSQYSTAPVEEPDTAWSVTIEADGSGSLTYAGPAQGPAPLEPRPGLQPGQRAQIKFRMVWQCNDRATPVGVGLGATPTATTQPGPPRPGSPSKVSLVVVIASAVLLLAVLTLLGLLYRSRLRQRRRPPCQCSATISVSGPSQIGIRDCARPTHWTIPGHLTSEVLEGDGVEGRQVSAVLHAECTGGGTAEIASVAWSVRQTDAGHLAVTAEARVIVTCPGEEAAETRATGQLVIDLVAHPCCGPDITEQFLSTVNETFDRLAADPPFSATVFMVLNGRRIVCRPFDRGTFFPGGCPSTTQCADTVTVFGRCVDCYVPDNFYFGAIAGWLELPVAEMELMGWGAKLPKTDLGVVPGHVISEQLWNEGHTLGMQARDLHRHGRRYHLDAPDLERALRVAQIRDDCGKCDQPAPRWFWIDFGREPWH